jgi:ABC-type branched-subunit amino acid transport system permease subunit
MPQLDAGERLRAVVIVVLLLLVVLLLPQLLSGYWVTVCTSVAIYSVVALGLGILIGRTGLVSLGQIALLALAAWVAARLFFATGLPFPIVLLGSGLITMVLGTLVGLPALRRIAVRRPARDRLVAADGRRHVEAGPRVDAGRGDRELERDGA